MHSTGQHNTFFGHSEVRSPHASTSHVTLDAMPRPIWSSSAMGPRPPVMTENAFNSPIYPPPQRPSLSATHHHPSRRHIALPPTVQGRVELNPLLLPRDEALIRYSLVTPPTTASAFGSNSSWMLEAATSPKLRSMTIATSDLIPWPIVVHASTINPFFVTVGDVLAAVHNALHIPVTEHEYRVVLRPNMAARGVRNHYWNGMKRLDLLNDRHWWAGLSKSQEGPEMWNLHLQR